MKKVYQRILDSKRGDCFKCAVCSIFELDYEAVPNFSELYGSGEWFVQAYKFIAKLGYEYSADTLWNLNVHFLENPTDCCFNNRNVVAEKSLDALTPEDGINGLFLASVYSPKYSDPNEHPMSHLHAVICDINFNIVFDPNPNYDGILCYPYSKLIGYNGIRTIDTFQKLKQ